MTGENVGVEPVSPSLGKSSVGGLPEEVDKKGGPVPRGQDTVAVEVDVRWVVGDEGRPSREPTTEDEVGVWVGLRRVDVGLLGPVLLSGHLRDRGPRYDPRR